MDSTGFFLAAFHTGMKVANIAVNSAIAMIIHTDTMPNTNIDAPIAAPILSLST